MAEFTPKVLVLVGVNIIFSIAIVFINKWIYTHHGFPNITMTCLHFIYTTVGLVICNRIGIFQVKYIPIKKMIPLSLSFCGFVVFTNLSLQTNTLGTYQLAKVMTTPGVILIQTYFYERNFSKGVHMTLIPIILGVFLDTYHDIHLTVAGIVFASVGVIATSVYQVWVAEFQHELQINTMQLLYYQAPLSATLLMALVPFFEPVFTEQGIFSPWSIEAILLISLTGVLAIVVNLTMFWLLGNTSPLTYNMMGHLKFCIVLVGSFLMFHDFLSVLQIIGIILALSGVMTYFFLQRPESVNVTEKH